MQRVMANRKSARVSYLRRKRRVAALQSRNSDLSQMNHALLEENKTLRLEVQELRQQVHFLRSSRTPTAGRLDNRQEPTSMPDGGLRGMSDLGIASRMAHPLQPGRSLLFSNAMSRVHHSFPIGNAPTPIQTSSLPSLNLARGCLNQNEEQDESTLGQLQRALFTEQFLAQSLNPPPTGH